eukprot:TRINITY_DN36176_c0_g1_i1.p1 TRINITY_DN36176_c0_g1~~TRINITY_DN36176_c0_g1_i1.p1  ORF type:complete len:281 (+),score=76.01 TRINITY_DN36176_c0_g1_i1:123-845(+)
MSPFQVQLEKACKAAVGEPCEPSWEEHADRSELLSQKQSLGHDMEELRATMRRLQEDGERCSNEARECEAVGALDLVRASVHRDKLATLRAQIRRSRQQSCEHFEAVQELRAELGRAAATYQEVSSLEGEMQSAVEIEIAQLQQVVHDLAARMESKAAEIERLERANEWAASEVVTSGKRWQQVSSQRQAALESGFAAAKAGGSCPLTSADALAGKDAVIEALPLLGFCLGVLRELPAAD